MNFFLILLTFLQTSTSNQICVRNILQESFEKLQNESQGHAMTMELINNIDFECIVERLKDKINCSLSDAEKIEISLKIGSLRFECAKDARKGQILYFESIVEISKHYINGDNDIARCLKWKLMNKFNNGSLGCEGIIEKYLKLFNTQKYFYKNCVVDYPQELALKITILQNGVLDDDTIKSIRKEFRNFINKAELICEEKSADIKNSSDSHRNANPIFISLFSVILSVTTLFQ